MKTIDCSHEIKFEFIFVNKRDKERERERERENLYKACGIYQNIQPPKIVRAFNLKAKKVEITQNMLRIENLWLFLHITLSNILDFLHILLYLQCIVYC